jgi:prepilin-type N-terminal cleavage/methylation domain-containing protein
MMVRRRKTYISGFTLIEILVVAAILALLAALLWPVLSKAKMSAKDAASMNNLKQLGNAYMLYVSDNDDRIPYVGNLTTIAGLRNGTFQIADFPKYAGQKSIKEALVPYVRNEHIWKSPCDPGESGYVGIESVYSVAGSSYDTFGAEFCSGSLSQIPKPSESALLREMGPFRRNKAFAWRADSSVKLLLWQEGADQITNAEVGLGCN